jgi:DNA replication protein DnaC
MAKASEILEKIAAATSRESTPNTLNTEAKKAEVCPICKGAEYVARDVPVGHPDFARLFPCRCKLAELEAKRFSDLRKMSNLGALSHLTFESFVPQGRFGLPEEQKASLERAYNQARNFAETAEGWLVLQGGFGCGKTHLAAAIANDRLQRGHPVLFVVVPDLLDHLRATYRPTSEVAYDERFEQVRTAPLLILDDLGTQSTTPWAQEKLYQIINYRYNERLPTVVNTNCELEEIDLRLRSRLVDPQLTTLVHIRAPDYRRPGKEDTSQSELSSLHLHHEQTFGNFDLRIHELPADERENLKQAFFNAQEYAQNPQDWLVFTGTFGCGKTHLAAAIANYRVSQGHSVLFVVVPDLLDHLRATFSPDSLISYDKRFEEVRTVPLLVLDDLGTESATPWAREKLFQLFNYRYNARLPTVITMEKSVEELEETNPRLSSRMLDISRCTVFAIIAPSYYGSGKKRGRKGQQRRTGSRKSQSRRNLGV